MDFLHKIGDKVCSNCDLHCVVGVNRFVIPKGATGVVLDNSKLPYVKWDVPIYGMHNAAGLSEKDDCTAEFQETLNERKENQ